MQLLRQVAWKFLAFVAQPYARALDFRGRETRRDAAFSLMVVYFVANTLLGTLPAFDLRDPLGAGLNLTLTRFVVEVVATAPLWALLVRRLHDAGLPGTPALPLIPAFLVLKLWRALALTFPTLGSPPVWVEVLWVAIVSTLGIFLFIVPPSRRADRYGPDPRLRVAGSAIC